MVQCCGCRLSVKPLVAAFRPTQRQNDLTRPFLILSASHPTLTGATADWPSPPLWGDRLRQGFWPAPPRRPGLESSQRPGHRTPV